MKRIVAAAMALALAACEGIPVRLGSPVDGPPPTGQSRELHAEQCGFQLLLLIPIAINGRQAAAYRKLEAQALGDYITDVKVQERWTYAFVGTLYCTILDAKAIRKA